MSKSKTPLYIKNFGVGKYVSPVKEEEENKEEKPKTNIVEKGGDSEKEDKGWVKAAKHATNALSTALGSVYGGTVNIQKINRKKDEDVKDEVDNENPGEDLNSEKTEQNIDKLLAGEDGGFSSFITNAQQGNDFRQWVNDNHPDYAKEIDLDASGSFSNSYIKEAWGKLGGEFAKKDNKSMEDQHNSALPMVSPLKAKRGVRGRSATRGKSTSTRRRRGGFTTGGKGGKNLGFYNVQTRFSPRDTTIKPIKGGVSTGGGGGSGKPYSYDKMGNMVFSPTIINNVGGGGGDAKADAWAKSGSTGPEYEWVPPEYSERKLEGYDEFWEKRIGDESKWSDGMKQYLKGVDMSNPDAVSSARAEWDKVSRANAHRRNKGKSTKRVKTADGYYRQTSPGSSWSESGSSSAATFKGKLNLGGYRTMHGK
tara:strand:+ start:986 stop:2254 length:1269 start_codon:yes stop_codon:yes gene_type:complete